MDTVFLEQLWVLAVTHSAATAAVISGFVTLLLAVVWLAWWIRGHIAQGRIDTLEERLRLASDQQKIIAAETKRIQEVMPQLPQTNSSAVVAHSAATILAASTDLGVTVTLPPDGRYRFVIEPTNRSD